MRARPLVAAGLVGVCINVRCGAFQLIYRHPTRTTTAQFAAYNRAYAYHIAALAVLTYTLTVATVRVEQ